MVEVDEVQHGAVTGEVAVDVGHTVNHKSFCSFPRSAAALIGWYLLEGRS